MTAIPTRLWLRGAADDVGARVRHLLRHARHPPHPRHHRRSLTSTSTYLREEGEGTDLARFLGLGVVTGLIKAGRLYRRLKARLRGQRSPAKKAPVVEGMEGMEMLDDEDASVPLSISLLILIGYPVLGALYFMHCEPEWSFLEAFYFALAAVLTVLFLSFWGPSRRVER